MDEITGDLLTLRYVKLDDALAWLWAENPKKHEPDGDVAQIAASIRLHGFRDPSIYDASMGGIPAGRAGQRPAPAARGAAAPGGCAAAAGRRRSCH